MKSKPLVQIYQRQTATGKTIYLHYTINGRQVRESTGLRLTGNKEQDREAQRAAVLLQADKINELLTSKTGLITDSLKSKILLTDFCVNLAEDCKREGRKSRKGAINALANHLRAYKPKARLCDIDKAYCCGFIDYLQTRAQLAATSVVGMYKDFVAVLNKAVKADLIAVNYAARVDRPTAKQPERVFLTENELKAFAAVETEGAAKEVQAAFLFSCLCGLRYSDISRLTADNITATGEGLKLNITTQKTGKQISFTLSGTAAAIVSDRLTTRAGGLFSLPSTPTLEIHVKRIAERAGISGKNVTFHTARHTFATLLLSKGADIYTISEMLAHSNIRTTQIYAKIVDAKKDAAAKLLEGVI
ncbi:MAG: site-specific integrase [Paludibacteraceae bacterium]|nr:site-specific integrase [Paludibacteraceae bacterium]